MSTWAPDKPPLRHPEWHYPTEQETAEARDGLAAARALRDEKAQARDAAGAALTALEERLASGGTVDRAERIAVNDIYKQADHDFQHEDGWVRSLETIALGRPIGAHQGTVKP